MHGTAKKTMLTFNKTGNFKKHAGIKNEKDAPKNIHKSVAILEIITRFFYHCDVLDDQVDTSLDINIYIYTYAYGNIHTHIHTHIYAYIHTHIYAYIHTHISTYIHTYVRSRSNFRRRLKGEDRSLEEILPAVCSAGNAMFKRATELLIK
jgi:hypothetical protein